MSKSIEITLKITELSAGKYAISYKLPGDVKAVFIAEQFHVAREAISEAVANVINKRLAQKKLTSQEQILAFVKQEVDKLFISDLALDDKPEKLTKNG